MTSYLGVEIATIIYPYFGSLYGKFWDCLLWLHITVYVSGWVDEHNVYNVYIYIIHIVIILVILKSLL